MDQAHPDLFSKVAEKTLNTRLRDEALRYAREWAGTQNDFRLDEEWVFVREEGDRTYHTVHRFHPYYALFPPPLIGKLLTEYSQPGDLVVDGFCGGGVTAVESMLLGRNAYSSDISPLAALVTKVKTTPISISAEWINKFSQEVQASLSEIKHGREPRGIELPNMHNIGHWFSPPTQIKLALILKMTREIENLDLRDFVLVAFSSILRKCSTSQNLESHLRVRKGKKPTDPVAFIPRLSDMVRRMEAFRQQLPPNPPISRVECADARMLSERTGVEVADLIVTSPPYGTTAKYTSIYKLSFDWLGLPRPRRPLEAAKDFLKEIEISLQQMFIALKSHRHCCFIYGTNKEFRSGQIIEIARDVGFQTALAVSAPVIDASKSVRGDYRRSVPIEHILVLRKP